MTITRDKKYLVDDRPLSPFELIDEAKALDQAFAKDWLKQTSVAADILRRAGHTVERIAQQ